MAQTKKKRKTKHRGTQAGTVERAGRTSRQTRQAARTTTKKTASDRRAQRFERPPTWRNAASRAALAAVFFGVVVTLLLHKPAVTGLSLRIPRNSLFISAMDSFVLSVCTGANAMNGRCPRAAHRTLCAP